MTTKEALKKLIEKSMTMNSYPSVLRKSLSTAMLNSPQQEMKALVDIFKQEAKEKTMFDLDSVTNEIDIENLVEETESLERELQEDMRIFAEGAQSTREEKRAMNLMKNL